MAGASVQFRMAPLAMAVEARALSDWVARAAPGDRMVYAQGVVPPRTSAAWALARELAASKLIALLTRRGESGVEWIAERRASEPVAQPPRPEPDRLMQRVAAELLRAANAGEVCPTDLELAERCSLSGANAASYRLRKAIRAGLVLVRPPRQPGERRVATDPQTGRSTPRGLL